MIRASSNRILLACMAALLMHALLFLVSLPAGGRQGRAVQSPPSTQYTGRILPDTGSTAAEPARVTWSPVVFSLPSELGFSHALTVNEVQTRKAFAQPQIRSEHFLEAEPPVRSEAERLDAGSLMISALERSPSVPGVGQPPLRPYSTPVRVMLPARLRERLVGGVILPADLNREVEKPWMVRATLGISDQGAVEHVLLDQPLESPDLNRQVIQMLRGLRFRPGAPLNASLEVYSPEPVRKEASE